MRPPKEWPRRGWVDRERSDARRRQRSAPPGRKWAGSRRPRPSLHIGEVVAEGGDASVGHALRDGLQVWRAACSCLPRGRAPAGESLHRGRAGGRRHRPFRGSPGNFVSVERYGMKIIMPRRSRPGGGNVKRFVSSDEPVAGLRDSLPAGWISENTEEK